jgi:hypothetical protein
MKKVSLLLFGQARHLDNPRSGIGFKEFIFDRYDTAICGHTWNEKTYIPSSWTNSRPIKNENIIPKINSLYPGILLLDEPQIDFKQPTQDLNNIFSQFYSIETVGELFSRSNNPDDFDLIILSRWDCDLQSLEPLDNLPEGFYTIRDHSPGVPHPSDMADQLVIFSPKYIKYMDLYSDIDNLKHFFPGVEDAKLDHYKRIFPNEPIKRHHFALELIREP